MLAVVVVVTALTLVVAAAGVIQRYGRQQAMRHHPTNGL
jgi:hypothetical protein